MVESDIDEAIKWLKYEGPSKKLGGILALKQLLIEAPIITFNRIFSNEQ